MDRSQSWSGRYLSIPRRRDGAGQGGVVVDDVGLGVCVGDHEASQSVTHRHHLVEGEASLTFRCQGS